MKFGKFELAGLVLVLSSFAAVAILYQQLPDIVPVHWGLRGEANRFAPKPWGPFVGPITSAALFILFLGLPHISPKGFRIEPFLRVYRFIQLTLQIFLFAILVVQLLAGTGLAVPIGRVVIVSAGALMAVMGNLMGKVRKNFFVGIRTPWTLSNDEVWSRTQRLGGWLMVLAGSVIVIAGLIGRGILIGIAALSAAAVVPVIYSYIVSRQVERSELKMRR
jgi:uncharacterized membrane protein